MTCCCCGCSHTYVLFVKIQVWTASVNYRACVGLIRDEGHCQEGSICEDIWDSHVPNVGDGHDEGKRFMDGINKRYVCGTDGNEYAYLADVLFLKNPAQEVKHEDTMNLFFDDTHALPHMRKRTKAFSVVACCT